MSSDNVGRPQAMDESVRRRMSSQRRRDTSPELRLRRHLHRLGYRYLVDAPLPEMPRRRADLLFTRNRIAIFVDGCFWHGCPEHRTHPTNNADWWGRKIDANVARDRETDEHLLSIGWRAVRIWEHEDAETALKHAVDALGGPRVRTTS